MVEITFKSANNKIDGVYYHSVDPDSQIALILVGDKSEYMQHKETIDCLANEFVKKSFSVFRICFVRVNSKETRDDELVGSEEQELFDATSALNWLHDKNPEAKGCWICGYGYGSLSALQLVMRRPEVDNYMIISPALKGSDLSFIVPCVANGVLIKSTSDSTLSDGDLYNLQEKLITKCDCKVEAEILETKEDDFIDDLESFTTTIKSYINERLQEYMKNSINLIDKKRRRRKKRLTEEVEVGPTYVNPVKPLDLSSI